MKYKVGDIVKVREDLKAGNDNGKLFVTSDMAELAGKLVTIHDIERICDDDYYHIVENDFLWIDDFFENEDKSGNVDKIIKEEKKSDEYEDIIDKVLSEMSEETKDTLIKQFIKGESKIAITASPIYKTISRTNGVSIQEIIGTKYGVAIVNKDGMVTL
jgi:hypothetical protein